MPLFTRGTSYGIGCASRHWAINNSPRALRLARRRNAWAIRSRPISAAFSGDRVAAKAVHSLSAAAGVASTCGAASDCNQRSSCCSQRSSESPGAFSSRKSTLASACVAAEASARAASLPGTQGAVPNSSARAGADSICRASSWRSQSMAEAPSGSTAPSIRFSPEALRSHSQRHGICANSGRSPKA